MLHVYIMIKDEIFMIIIIIELQAAGYTDASATAIPSVVVTTQSPSIAPTVTVSAKSSSSRPYTAIVSYISLFFFLYY